MCWASVFLFIFMPKGNKFNFHRLAVGTLFSRSHKLLETVTFYFKNTNKSPNLNNKTIDQLLCPACKVQVSTVFQSWPIYKCDQTWTVALSLKFVALRQRALTFSLRQSKKIYTEWMTPSSWLVLARRSSLFSVELERSPSVWIEVRSSEVKMLEDSAGFCHTRHFYGGASAR